MNEGDSAGGGQQGLSPVPPAVPDRRSTTISVPIVTTNPNITSVYNQGIHNNRSTSSSSGSAVLSLNTLQQPQNHQQHHMSVRHIPSGNFLITNPQRIVITQNQPSLSSSTPSATVSSSLHQIHIQQQPQIQTSSSPSGLTRVVHSSVSSNINNSTLRTTASTTFQQSSSTSSSTPLLVITPINTTVNTVQNQTPNQSVPEYISNQLSPVGRKRLKFESNSSKVNTTESNIVNSNESGDISALKRRILEHKFSRLRSIQEKHAENVAELFFLQTGGNMMDYPFWRKKQPSAQFINFSKQYKLEGNIKSEEVEQQQQPAKPVVQTQTTPVVSEATATTITTTIATTTTTTTTNLPKGAEIKIPSVGATPVAVSTTLPAAVVQLSQKGHIPGRPQGGRHGMVFGQIPVPPAVGNTSVPLVPGGTPIVPDISSNNTTVADKTRLPNVTNVTGITNYAQNSPTSSNGVQDQFSVKAKQEAYVMQRISELQREGLWTEKRLPKLQEPTRPKAHWDYLLEEMVWLAADFAQERKWKKSAAKKCARMVQKYFQDKANAAQKAEKAQELHLKRVAGFIAKEIKLFWSNVEKLVEYKHQTKLEEKRKKALDQHLSFIVDQTEKFSQQLAEGMNKPVADNSAAPSVDSSRISSPKPKGSDDEFRPDESSEDDEETIAKAEAEAGNVKEEIAALEKEAEMDLDDFLKELPKDYLQNRDKIVLSESESSDDDQSGDGEFKAEENSTDDEDTIMEQEKQEKNVDHKKELEELNADNEMSIEELMNKYKKSSATSKVEKMEVDSDDDEDEESDDSEATSDMSEDDDEATEDEEKSGAEAGSTDLKLLVTDDKKTSEENEDHLINDAAAIAESIQPKGNTLSSTNVVTPVPFLLKHSLREYQHIGLDWLVTMHDRKLNGILADEMGLGKTIQTISLLAHLACEKANWGPHLIIVPSSVMLNWEMEFKKWCPGFKILTYYGTQKERKQKRIGWTKFNAFHVCITSYKLVIQDQQSFRRKKWKYLILDEAQNIKNFKSQRWQLLLNFQTEQRLLLTGTPLQNNLMELWSLMHFLMPHVFQSHREFKEWFSNPMTGMIEGNSEYNDSIIKRLHKVLRPFLLRRLKSEVEKQMPKKYEHVVMCRLSKRQRYLYDDFMSRAKTKETLATGNLLSVINVLMQLRKVCNHPNLFEVRPTISPFRMEGIKYRAPSIVYNALDYDPLKHIDLASLNLVLIQLELCLTAYVSHRIKRLQTPRKLIEEIDSVPDPPPRCPSGKYKFHIRIRDTRVHDNLISHSGVRVGTSPAMKTEGNKLVPVINNVRLKRSHSEDATTIPTISTNNVPVTLTQINSNVVRRPDVTTSRISNGNNLQNSNNSATTQIAQIVQTTSGRQIVLTPATSGTVLTPSGQRITVLGKVTSNFQQKNVMSSPVIGTSMPRLSSQVPTNQQTTTQVQATSSSSSNGNQNLVIALAQHLKSNTMSNSNKNVKNLPPSDSDIEFDYVDQEQLKKDRRQQKLASLVRINQKRCDCSPIYGEDYRESITNAMRQCHNVEYTNWNSRSYVNCLNAMRRHGVIWSLSEILKSYEVRTHEMKSQFENFVLFVPAVSAPEPSLHISHPHPSKVSQENIRNSLVQREMSPKLALLHPIMSAMSTQFPDPRLIQYDCGKLQTLNRLLRQLKYEGHRILIFTQMTKMLDVLEAFLNYHGHIYLRLDGTTKVEQRQILMERFNGDKRIFAFILSTRSGGVGVNLTGADTVIFYDSDWNPTMDAQAQDRCHRIGQTRDVHIYRLVSEKTIEENILKKANQKRLLGDLAIEGGNFTTAYFKSSTIQDLFQVESGDDASTRLSEVIDRDRERKQRLHESLQNANAGNEEKSALGVFESALAAAEDEQDVEAAKTAKDEAAAELDEFDENIPLDEVGDKPEISKADQEVENLVKQLSPIERYAMRFVEETGGSWTAEQLKAAEAEIEQQKREWEANRLAALQKEEEMRKAEEEADELLTYSCEDAKNQIWISENTGEKMPMWCPPTPPQNDNDIYIDYSLSFLYDSDIMPESHLPPIYVKKEYKRTRTDAGFYAEGRRPPKIRKEDNYYAPRSLFDRPPAAVAKIRRDLKIQRYRGVFKPNIQIPGLKQQMPLKPVVEPEGMAEWCIYEDIAILHVLQNLQGLPLNLMLLSPGHTPNFDLVSDTVNQYSRTYRSTKQCRYRYEAIIVPREEGKLLENPKKQKKIKNAMKSSPVKSGVKSLRTSQLFISDNNSSFTKLMKLKFDTIKSAYMKKAPPPKQVFGVPNQKNSKHAAVLADFGVTTYDNPLTPIDIAIKKAERTKEKQKSMSSSLSQQESGQQTSQQNVPNVQSQTSNIIIQQQQQQSQGQTQQSAQVQQQVQSQTTSQQMQQQGIQQVTQIIQQTAAQSRQTANISIHQQPTQIVKAIVTPTSNVISGQVQHISSPGQQVQIQQQGTMQPQGNIVTQSAVSVVLTAPVSTLSSVQQQQNQSTQIVSIQQQALPQSTTIVSQPQTNSLIQTISTQSMPQVVSVSQLATVGTVLTTSTSLQPTSGTVATLNTSALRAQRIVTAPGNLQEVVLQPRSNTQSPTIVSMSNLGQSVTQAQLQAAQLRLSMGGTQQLQGVVAKGISVQQAGKPGSQTTQMQLYRQQTLRQQLKVLQGNAGQTSGAAAVVQTASGQTALVNAAGTIIQSGIVPGQTVQVQGQKVSVATVSGANVVAGGSSGVVTSVATVQVAPVQGRTQFIKQVGVGGKQTITRPVTESEMLLVKRQLMGQHKAQVIPQTQLFAPANVQVQQAGTSGQQQIATLVKTSSGTVATGGTVGMTLSQIKPGGQIKVTMANQVRRLQLQHQIAIAQQRKTGKMPQIGQVTSTGVPTQLIVQNPKNLPGSMTVQQIQQVIRHAAPGTIASAGQIVLGKGGRVIPVSQNARQTIQVVSAASAQALTGNIRTHVTNQQNIGTIKVATGATQAQTQQALINALQSQQNQRQNASPIRLQTTSGGSLVAVTVQQPGTSNVSSPATGTPDTSNIGQQTQQQTQQQQPPK